MGNEKMACLLIYSCCVYAFASASAQVESASIEIEDSTYDFGIITKGEVLNHSFHIINKGGSILKLSAYVVSCKSCLTILEAPQELEPQETGVITIRFDSNDKRGRVVQHVLFQTNDPANTNPSLQVAATVKGIWLVPDSLDYGYVNNEKEYKKECLVYATEMDNKVPTFEISRKNGMEINYCPIIEEDKYEHNGVSVIGRIEVVWKPQDEKIGDYHNCLTMLIGQESYQTARLKINAYVLGDNKIRIPKIFFGRVKPKQKISRSYLLSKYIDIDKIKVEDTDIKADHEFIESRLVRDANDILLNTTLIAPCTGENRVISGELIFAIDEITFLGIPYFAYLLNVPE